MLLERPGEIVTREELRNRLWPADTFVDFDHGLNAAVKRLRDALGDSAENPRFVETLARRGYRLVAPVRGPNSKEPISKKPGAVAARPRHQWQIAAAVVAILMMGSGAGWVVARRLNPKVQILEKRLTGNPEDDPILSAVISPDAKYLAFANRSDLFLRVIATGETHHVPLPNNFRAQPTGWFPDGSHLLVTRASGPGGVPSLWSVSVFGGDPRKLMENAQARSVSPDGSQIAFVQGPPLNQAIWLMSAEGQGPRKILGELGNMFASVAWSPDGRSLAFVRFDYKSGYKEGTPSLGIVKLADGATSIIISDNGLGEALAWTPDGRLIYSLAEPRTNHSDTNLWALAIDQRSLHLAGAPIRLTNGPDQKVQLSLSADGKRLAFLRWRGEPQVYVADVEEDYSRLSPPRHLSLDEGRNLPIAWTPDSKFVFFSSDRDGPSHIFRQGVDQPAPDLQIGGPNSIPIARLNPDGSQLLYLITPPAGDISGLARLMRQPLAGGDHELLVEEPHINNFQCARLPATTCIFSRSSPQNYSFFTFDALTGKEQPLTSLDGRVTSDCNWSLAPDGNTLAVTRWHGAQAAAEIRLLSLRDGAMRTLSLPEWAGSGPIDWSADGRSLWTSVQSATGTRALLNVDLRGHARPLLQDTQKQIGWAIPSPDGRHIAYWQAGGSSNAWLLQGF
jgi:Tol biopolymer transport system component